MVIFSGNSSFKVQWFLLKANKKTCLKQGYRLLYLLAIGLYYNWRIQIWINCVSRIQQTACTMLLMGQLDRFTHKANIGLKFVFVC